MRTAFFLSLILRPPSSTLFPYTTLFRSSSSLELWLSVLLQFLRGRQHGRRSLARPISRTDRQHHPPTGQGLRRQRDRKSTRLNSSHRCISYAVFCLKKKKKKNRTHRDRN